MGIAESAQSVLQFLFNAGEADQVFIKIGIFLIFFGLMYKGAQQVFSKDKTNKFAIVIALVISFLGTRFMPSEWVTRLGAGAGMLTTAILIIGLVLAPYAIISSFTQPGWFRRILVGITIILLLYLISGLSHGMPSMPGFGSLQYFSWTRWPIEIWEDFYYFLRRAEWWELVLVVFGTVAAGTMLRQFSKWIMGLGKPAPGTPP